MGPKTAIVGGGLGGLVLARVLQRGGASAVVYERDEQAGSRAQGGSLDVHVESGQRALAAAGLMDGFRRHARSDGEEIRILDPAATLWVHHRGAPGPSASSPEGEDDEWVGQRPEIDRAVLRALLLQSLEPTAIRWGSHVVGVQPRAGGGFVLTFADGRSEECDLLVGADGARSRVRPLVTPVEPVDTGIRYAELWLRHLDRAHPHLGALLGAGSLWCLGSDLNVGAQRGGLDEARVSVMWRRGPSTSPSGASEHGLVTKAHLLELLAGWSPTITALIEAAEDEVIARSLATLPADLRWAHRGDVTLIGDAAHLMAPVGEGANQAMLDGAELGRLLLAHPHDPAVAVRLAEEAMFDRVQPIAEESALMQDRILAPDALATMTALFGGPLA